QAFTILFNRYRNKIYSIATDLTESTATAEEVVQDVFLKIWLKRDSMNEIRYFRAYLFTSARNHIINAIRKSRLQQLREQEAVKSGEAIQENAASLILEKEYNLVFQRAISRLSPQQAQVYHHIKEKGYTREQVAELMGLSPDTIESHLAQAMRNIRAYCVAHIDLCIIFTL